MGPSPCTSELPKLAHTTAAMLLGGYAVGSLVRRRTTSRTMMVTGLLLASGGCLLMSVLHNDVALVALFATLISFGCGIGYAATPNLLIESAPARLQATAGR